MKKILYIIILVLCCGMTAHANTASIAEIKAQLEKMQLPYGVSVVGDSLHVDWKAFFSVESNRIKFKEAMQKKLSQSGVNDIELADLGFEEQTITPQVAQAKDGRKKTVIKNVSFNVTQKYYYMSVDGQNNPVKLSAIMYIPRCYEWDYASNYSLGLVTFIWGIGVMDPIEALIRCWFSHIIDYGYLNCHPTVLANAEAPTGANPVDGDVAMFTSNHALVVCPDYCGYGITSYRQHPYLVQGVTARNCIDGYLAALKILDKMDEDYRGSGFYSIFMGYSQGGSVALACQKYYESGQLSSADSANINLDHVILGDGPYSPVATVKQYIEWANDADTTKCQLAFPCVLPLIMSAAKQAYDNDCMHTVKVEDFFTPEFLATGIIDDINAKTINTDASNAKTKSAGIKYLYQMLSDKVIIKDTTYVNGKLTVKVRPNEDSREYKCLMRALDKNDLTKGWKPKFPMAMMHYKRDLVVPYCNTQALEALCKSAGTKYKYYDPVECQVKVALGAYMFGYVFSDLVKRCFENADHPSMGTYFYLMVAGDAFNDVWGPVFNDVYGEMK